MNLNDIRQVHKANAWLGMLLSALTAVMTVAFLVIHFWFNHDQNIMVITFAAWGILCLVIVIAQTWLLGKSSKLLAERRKELDKLFERLKQQHGPDT